MGFRIVNGKLIELDEFLECIYCGDLANSVDHLYPSPWTGVPNKYKDRGPTVSCCRPCNSILRDIAIHTIGERREYIKERLKEKNWRFLKEFTWPTDKELEEYGRTLRVGIISYTMKYANLKSRIAYPNSPRWVNDPEKVKQILRWGSFNFD